MMIAGCHPGDCHYNSGNYKARRRIILLRNMLTQLGIEPERLKLEWISPSEASKLRSAVNGFIDEVTERGPLTLNTRTPKKNRVQEVLKEFLPSQGLPATEREGYAITDHIKK